MAWTWPNIVWELSQLQNWSCERHKWTLIDVEICITETHVCSFFPTSIFWRWALTWMIHLQCWHFLVFWCKLHCSRQLISPWNLCLASVNRTTGNASHVIEKALIYCSAIDRPSSVRWWSETFFLGFGAFVPVIGKAELPDWLIATIRILSLRMIWWSSGVSKTGWFCSSFWCWE